MSKTLESQVWKSALDPELKPIAAVMADMGNDDGLGIYPSVAYLAWLLGRSDRFIQSGLKKLCDLGVLDRVGNATGGRGLTPRYRLSGDSLPKRPNWGETRKGEIRAPFPKGEIHDQKGANDDVKGAQFAPDPLEGSVSKIREVTRARAKPKRKWKPDEYVKPPFFGDEFTQAMKDYREVRETTLKPRLGAPALRALYRELAELGEDKAVRWLTMATSTGYRKVFDPDTRPAQSSARTEYQSDEKLGPDGTPARQVTAEDLIERCPDLNADDVRAHYEGRLEWKDVRPSA